MVGHSESADPAYMPLDPDEAELFRNRAHEHQETFWCGHLLGGCGGQLSLKIIHERETVPHFAHRADSNECARLHKGGEGTLGGHSADHLYAHRHLRAWLGERAADAQAKYEGLAKGRACTTLVVPTSGKHLRLVFTHDLDHELVDLAKSAEAHDYVWLVRANQAVTRALVANGVPYRLFRLADADGLTRTVQVGIRDGAGEVVWTPLGECILQGDTLVKTRSEAAPVPVQRRPEPRSELTTPTDPLEQALRGLSHVLDQQDMANVRTMAQQVQMRLRQARNRGLAPHLIDEARTLLQQASDALPTREVVAKPRQVPVVPERPRVPRRGAFLPHHHARREADKYLGKLQWAQERQYSRAYNDNRAALVRMLTGPEVPKDVTDWIKQQLREFPKDQFDRSAAPPARKPRRTAEPEGRDRSRGASTRQRTERIRAKADELLDTLHWAYNGKMPQTYDDTRAQLTDVLSRSSTPEELRDKIRAQLRRLPDSLAIPPVPAPAPPPKKSQKAQKPDRRSRHGRSEKPAPRRRAPAPSGNSDAGILANARIDERSRRLLEQLQNAPQTSTPDGTER
ncbi:hypothetical protein GCM10027590_32510 [Nocardiopsis nanhaiensis]